MKRLLAVVCCVLLLSGCSQSSPPAAPSSPSSVGTSADAWELESYQKVPLGGYTAKIPVDWVINDQFMYMSGEIGYPFISTHVFSEYDSLDDLFSSGFEEDFIAGACSELYDNPAYSHSDIKEITYGDISACSFNAVGQIDGSTVSFLCNLFDNPGGGVLAIFMLDDTEGDIANDTHDYLRIFYNMTPADSSASVPDGSSNSAPSDSSSYEVLSSKYNFSRIGNVNNDKTGKWRLYECATTADIGEYIYDFCSSCVASDDDIYFIVNFTLGVTYRIDPMGSIVLVDTLEYVDGEEHDASTLASGMSLADTRMFDLDTRTESE